jgi:hypothetical protein
MEIGRNEPCPCGSGKKYKKCCLMAQEVSFDESSLLLDAESRLNNKLFAFYESNNDDIPVEEVGTMLFGNDFGEIMLLDDEAKEIMFNQFCIFDYKSPGGSTLCEKFHVEQYLSLDEYEKKLINQWRDARWGLFEVQEVYPGKGSCLKDVFSDKTYNLKDISTSRQLKKWDLVFSKIKPVGSIWRFCTTGFIHGQRQKSSISEFICDTFEQYKRKKKVSTLDEFINTYPHLVIHQQLTATSAMPKSITPEGDEVEWCKAVYAVDDYKKAADILTGHEDFRKDDVEKNSSGDPIKYHIGWHNTGDSYGIVEVIPGYRPSTVYKKDDKDIVRSLGHITVESTLLTLECMSKRRMMAGKKRIEALLKDLIRHCNDECKTMEQALHERQQTHEDEVPTAKVAIPEEVKDELIKKDLERYRSCWADMSIPMLHHFTPRDAAMTEAGEELLEELWKYMENMEIHSNQSGNRFSVPVSVLRDRLVQAKAETEALITGEHIKFDGTEVEKSGKDFLEDFSVFTGFVAATKVKLTPKHKFIADDQVKDINKLLKVKEHFALTFEGVSFELEKRESNKDRLYLIDMLSRVMGITSINSNHILEISPIPAKKFASLPECLKLWQLFATWWYKIYWNQSLPGEMGNPDHQICDSLVKKIFIKTMLEKSVKHYPLKELVLHVFEQLGKDPDDFEFIGPVMEKFMVLPLVWFGIVEAKKENVFSKPGIKTHNKLMEGIGTLKVTTMGKRFLSHLILCQD